MSEVETKSKLDKTGKDRGDAWPPEPMIQETARPHVRVMSILITLATVAFAVPLSWAMWNAYMEAPWTRDGVVRAYVVAMAPDVAGHIVELPVVDNQFVRKGDLLVVIDPTNYRIAVNLAEAAVRQAHANAQNAARLAKRRQNLPDLAVTAEERQTFATRAVIAKAQYRRALTSLEQARVNLKRTEIRSPVNGWVTNLLAQRGDYANVGQSIISVVDRDSFWIDGYFEETQIGRLREGDPATIKLMGYSQIVRGHIGSIARAINVPNAQPDQRGLASVNPIFTWVRLAQRIPVRIDIDHVPDGVILAGGMTATVQINPRPKQPDG